MPAQRFSFVCCFDLSFASQFEVLSPTVFGMISGFLSGRALARLAVVSPLLSRASAHSSLELLWRNWFLNDIGCRPFRLHQQDGVLTYNENLTCGALTSLSAD